MIGYKFTTSDNHSPTGSAEGEFHWRPGALIELPVGELFSFDGWIIVCDNIETAVVLSPLANCKKLWEVEWSGKTATDESGLWRGVERCQAIREVPLPVISVEQMAEIVKILRPGEEVEYSRRKIAFSVLIYQIARDARLQGVVIDLPKVFRQVTEV